MIIFEGTKNRGPVHFLLFGNEQGHVEIPMDERICRMILAHLEALKSPDEELVEAPGPEDDEASERIEVRRGAKNEQTS